jgi:hypothetical protein
LIDIAYIGMSTAAPSISVMNRIQTASLNQEMKTVRETILTLQKTQYTQDAPILQLIDGQFKLAVELNSTQQAIIRTM